MADGYWSVDTDSVFDIIFIIDNIRNPIDDFFEQNQ